MRSFFWALVVVLGTCQTALGWSFLTPKSVVAHRSPTPLTDYQFPYTFTIYKNNTQGQDQQVNLQYVTATPFFWDNNQPVGASLKFRIVDANNFVATTEYVPVLPNPTFVSSRSVQSTASAASVGSTVVQNTNSVPQPTPISTPTGIVTSTATPSPVKTNVGAIAGGVVGGVMILATITAVAALFFYRRRKRSNSPEK
ncbi:hypothetical protein FRC09_018438, partial [Ceratobasidium sp. 395]